LPDENLNKMPNSAKKGQTNYLKARKNLNFVCGIAIHFSQKTTKLQEYHWKFYLK